MQAETSKNITARPDVHAGSFPALELETRPTVGTAQAAHYLNRAQRTLLIWACKSGKGPITPRRVGGRLAWPVAEIKSLLGVQQ
jgi:hypothetical protein